MNYSEIVVDAKSDIDLLFAGDLCPMGQIEQTCINDEQDQICYNFKKYFENNDLFIANLESPLTKSNHKIIKSGPSLKGS